MTDCFGSTTEVKLILSQRTDQPSIADRILLPTGKAVDHMLRMSNSLRRTLMIQGVIEHSSIFSVQLYYSV